jgi:hypothetical protein
LNSFFDELKNQLQTNLGWMMDAKYKFTSNQKSILSPVRFDEKNEQGVDCEDLVIKRYRIHI